MWEGAERRDGKIGSGPKEKGLFPVSLAPSLSSRKTRNQNSKNRELYCQREVFGTGAGKLRPSPRSLGWGKGLHTVHIEGTNGEASSLMSPHPVTHQVSPFPSREAPWLASDRDPGLE